MWIVLQLIKCAKRLNFSIFEHYDLISKVQEVNRVGYQDASLFFEHALEDSLEDLFPNIRIEG